MLDIDCHGDSHRSAPNFFSSPYRCWSVAAAMLDSTLKAFDGVFLQFYQIKKKPET